LGQLWPTQKTLVKVGVVAQTQSWRGGFKEPKSGGEKALARRGGGGNKFVVSPGKPRTPLEGGWGGGQN